MADAVFVRDRDVQAWTPRRRPMFDEPGIDLGSDLAWIQRDQYVYYLEMAHALGVLGNPDDWASFRADLAEALAAHDGMGA